MADVYDHDDEGHRARVIALDDLRRRMADESTDPVYKGLILDNTRALVRALAALDGCGMDSLDLLRVLGQLMSDVTDNTLKAVGV